MSKNSKLIILISLLVMFLVVIVVIFSFIIGPKLTNTFLDIPDYNNDSVKATLVASNNIDPTDKQLETAKVILNNRLEHVGIFNTSISIDSNAVVIDIPLKENQTLKEVSDTIKKISQVSYLTVQDVDENKVDANGNYQPTGNIIIDNMDIMDASVHKSNDRPVIWVKLAKEAGIRFEEATASHIGKPLAIYIDDTFISSPVVQAKISDGAFVINGFKDTEEAKLFVILIRSGQLPFKLDIKDILHERNK